MADRLSRMNKHTYLKSSALAVVAFTLFFRPGHADSCSPHTNFDLWADEEDAIAGMDVAYSNCLSEFSNFRFGLSYFSDDGVAYEGFTASFRLQHGDTIVPFFGIGALVGFSEDSVPATNDGIDNNGDGFIDEPGETVTQREGNAFFYPEAGIAFYVNGIGASLSARQYFGENLSGNIIHSLGISIRIP
jgi:hypothetical protein